MFCIRCVVLIDYFCRPTDPPEYNSLFLIPGGLFLGGYGYSALAGFDQVHQAAYLAASLCCVGALAGLSSQATSRIGNNLGIVSFFIIITDTNNALNHF